MISPVQRHCSLVADYAGEVLTSFGEGYAYDDTLETLETQYWWVGHPR